MILQAAPIGRPKIPPGKPRSEHVREVMQANKGVDTLPEQRVRSLLHRMGLRFRKHTQPVRGLRCRADVVFPTERVAVFIDGCFWHGCPDHGRVPSTNSPYWTEKLELNRRRDERNVRVLTKAGWRVLRYWEHEAPADVAKAVRTTVIGRRKALGR